MKKLNVLVPSVLALFVASAAHAGATFDTPQGKLNIGGDVEFDVIADNYSERGVANNDATDTQKTDGRILLDINGERVLANGNFAGFKLNPMWGQQGNHKDADDAWFNFGVKNDWSVKLGHFEAYDLSPAGQDTYVVGYQDDIYRANYGRGRDDNGGHVLFSKENGQWHFEVGTQFGDYDGGVPMGTVKNKDPLLARPVVAWTGDTVTVAAGAELNLISDAYTTLANGEGESQSDWTGYGLTTTVKATDDLSVGLRGAYLNDDDADKYSVGPFAQYQNFYLSYLYGKTDATEGADNAMKTNVVYASYKIPAVMGIDNFDMYLGTSWGNQKVGGEKLTDDEYGAKVRFKYFF